AHFLRPRFFGASLLYNTTNESAKMVEIGRFQARNFRFHTNFNFAFWFSPSRMEDKPVIFRRFPPVFLFPPPDDTLL
ncbi:hypothetical protein COT64_00155, partial [Candidatus Shapirobacteria bacterium CG09_land_8_20_14_0_10_39_12]